MTFTAAAVFALAFVAALVVGLAALHGMGRRVLVGDEHDYLMQSGSTSGGRPGLFVRPPLTALLARACRGTPASTEQRLRTCMVAAGAASVAVTAAAGWSLGGPAVALPAAVLLALQPERLLLSGHLWPDTLLGLLVAALCLVLAVPHDPGYEGPRVALLALICLAGVLVRIDFLGTVPLVWAALSAVRGDVYAWTLAALATPAAGALALWARRNRRQHGVALPDNTWVFNLMLAEAELQDEAATPFELDGALQGAVQRWQTAAPGAGRQALHFLRLVASRPLRYLTNVGRRTLVMCGPDVFIRQMLLPETAGYPELGRRGREAWTFVLGWSFPLLLSLAVVGTLLHDKSPAPCAWPALGLWAASVLFVARTRFRVAILPALSLLAAQGLAGLPGALAGAGVGPWTLLASLPLLFWALTSIDYPERYGAGHGKP